MSDNPDFRIIIDLVGVIQHFSERITVQRQFTAFGIILLTTGALALILRHLCTRYLIQRQRAFSASRRPARILLAMLSILRHLLFPIMALLVLTWAQREFLARGWHDGLLDRFILLFWAVLVYRLLIGLLYARLSVARARRYHLRFLAPLFLTLVILWMIDHLVPIPKLAAIVIWDGFTDPVTLGALLVATVGFYFWITGSGVAQDFGRYVIKPHLVADPGFVEASLVIGRYIMIAVGAYAAFAVLGFDSITLAFLTGGLSVGIGFGSKEIIGNLISGVLLLFDQSLHPDDIVDIEGQLGVVKNVGIRATTVITPNNVELVIPNQTFMTAAVTTYTKTDRQVRILIDVETADAHSPHEVRDALLTAARQHPLVADDPAPTVFYLGTGDTSYLYKLAIWCEDPLLTMPLTSEVYFLIYDRFSERGIRPSTPARDLSLMTSAELSHQRFNTGAPSGIEAVTVADPPAPVVEMPPMASAPKTQEPDSLRNPPWVSVGRRENHKETDTAMRSSGRRTR